MPRINFEMKSFYSSHLLIHSFSPCSGLRGLPGLAPLPFLTLSPALLPLTQAAASTLASLLSSHVPNTLSFQGCRTYSSLCMAFSSLSHLRGSHPHSRQISAQISFCQRDAIPGHLDKLCSTPTIFHPPQPT